MLNLKKRPSLTVVIVIRLIFVILLILGLKYANIRPILFVISGLVSGLYYGTYNDIIWDYKGKLKSDPSYRFHQLWIHMVCGLVAGISFYLLLFHLDFFSCALTLNMFSWVDFFLFTISILGFTGLLPSTLWFFSRSGNIKGP